MKKIYLLLFLLASFQGFTQYGQTYHNLSTSSFSQNWSNTGLIITSDDWSGHSSVRGFKGDGITGSTGVDPQTLLTTTTDIDVNANQSDPSAYTSGGVTEFEITNAVVGINGSSSADAPYLVFYLNTTGTTNINIQYKVRDLDASADNATQQVALQYRIGNTGDFINLPAGYIADATTGGSATQETNINVFLPADADNKAMVEIRVITTNAVGNDEYIGIDDILISGTVAGGDTTPPFASSLSPADNATGVAINATATITFSETIQKGTGNILVKNSSTNAVVQTIDVTSSAVTVAGNQASFALTLANSTDYHIEIAAGAFKDQANNNFAGILDNTTWNFTTIAAPLTGVIGTTYTFNNCSNFISQGFTTYSVTGPQVWTCTKFGRTYTTDPSTDSAMEMNGFSGSSQLNEDWLISPKFDLTATNIPLLDFYSKSRFEGNSLSLRVSTNYSGTGDPNAATWTTITGEFPVPNSDAWKLSDSLNLSAFKTANVYIAWVYTSTTSAASRWTLDDIKVYNSTVAPAPTITVNGRLLDFRFVAVGSTSAPKTFTFTANDVTDNVTVYAPTSTQVSKDGITYGNNITYTPAEIAAGTKTVFVRYTGLVPETHYGEIYIAATGISNRQVFIKGNSVPMSSTLNVVNWNIEYFGSASNGPSDNDLQQANAKKVMDSLSADAYGISEIVDVARFGNLVSSLNGGYSYVVADYCSSGSTAAACASAQKTAFVYKTSMFSNVSTRALLKTSTSANTNWSSGRLPMLVKADVTKNGVTETINFIVIHGKANTGTTAEQIDAYQRRKAGAQELKDTLDAFFSAANIILLGDFNDDLDRTIAPTTGVDTVSSYTMFVTDSTDANHYVSVTLPLSNWELSSTANNPEMIDHVVVSNELRAEYQFLSATIYTDIETVAGITDYANTTSDHYPVMTRFLLTPASDVTAPTLVSTDPANNSLTVPTTHTFRMNFSENIAAGTGNILVKKSSDNSVVTAVSAASLTISGQQASFNVTGLQNSTSYYVEVPNTAIKDLAGNFFAGITSTTAWTFTTMAPADVTAPALVSTDPPNNATNMPTTHTFRMNFSENVVAGTGNILVKKVSDNTPVATIPTASLTFSNQQASFSIPGLQNSTAYYIEVPNTAVKDPSGNFFAGISGPTGWTFTTAAPADVTAPTLISTVPANNATGVATPVILEMKFSENIMTGTGNVVVKRSSDNVVVATTTAAQISSNNADAWWTVTGLQAGTKYYVEVPSTVFKDFAGNAFAGISSTTAWTFTTASPTALPQIDPSVTEFAIQGNPTAGQLVFTYRPKAGKASYMIYDLSGKLVHQENKSVGSSKIVETINISGLSSGTYIISILNNGYYTIQKFVKQ